MNERNQKIFKIIVWISVFIFAIVGIALAIYSNSNPKITQTEWKQMLSESFGNDTLLKIKEDGEYLTGKYAAKTALFALGDEKIEYLKNSIQEPDYDLLDLALEFDIIKKSDFEEELNLKEAESIISKTLTLEFSPDYYPEYCDISYKENIIDVDLLGIKSYDETLDIMELYAEDDLSIGSVITFKNEFGIQELRRISNITINEEETVMVNLEKIEDVSQVIDSVSFSGAASFEYVTGKNNNYFNVNENSSNNINLDNTLTISPRFPFSTLDSKWDFNLKDFSAEKSELTEDTNKCDIEVVFEMESSSDNSNEKSDEYSITATLADSEYNDIKTLYKGSVDDSGKFKFEKQLLGFNHKLEMTDGKEKDKDNDDDKKFIETTKGVSAEFKISGLSICSQGFIELDNPDNPANNIELRVSADEISIKSAIKVGKEMQYKIAEIPVPIATGVSVKLGLYIVIGVNGEISLWYKIEKPYIGMTYDNQNGLTPIHGRFGDGTGIKAQADLELGFIAEAEVSVYGCNIIDPSIDVRVNGSVSTFDMPIGHELKPQYSKNNCLELELQLPIITLSATTGDDSVIYKALSNLKLTKEIKLIEKDSSFIYKIGYHVENEKSGDISFIELDLENENPKEHKDVCTHIQEIKIEPEIEDTETSIDINDEGNNSITDGPIEKIETEIDAELQEQEDKIMAVITAKIEEIVVRIIDEMFAEACS